MKYLKLFEDFSEDFDDEDEEDDEIHSEIESFFDNIRKLPSVNIYEYIDGESILVCNFYIKSIKSAVGQYLTVSIDGYCPNIFDLENKHYQNIDAFHDDIDRHDSVLKISTYYGASLNTNDVHFKKDEWDVFISVLKEKFPPYINDISQLPKCYPIPEEYLLTLIGKKIQFYEYGGETIYMVNNISIDSTGYVYDIAVKTEHTNKYGKSKLSDIELWKLLDTGDCDLETKVKIVL